MKREGFLLSTSVVDALDTLCVSDYVVLTKAVLHYCAYDEKPVGLSEELEIVFNAMKRLTLDQELEKYDKYMDRRIPKYNEWRKKVYERDGYTCQLCGRVGGRLNAHHIKTFAENPELRFDVDNGVTLCADCHKEVHRRRKK